MYVYVWRCLVNGKCYVGQTVNHYQTRFKEHVYEANTGSARLFCRALRKYGPDAFELVEVWQFDEESYLDAYERRLIDAHHSLAPGGYNSTEGGKDRWTHLPAARRQIGEAHSRKPNRRKMLQEQRRREAEAVFAARYRSIDLEDQIVIRETLKKLVNALPEKDRVVLDMKVQQFTDKEIGKVLGLTKNGTHTRWDRLKKRLRQELGEVSTNGRNQALI